MSLTWTFQLYEIFKIINNHLLSLSKKLLIDMPCGISQVWVFKFGPLLGHTCSSHQNNQIPPLVPIHNFHPIYYISPSRVWRVLTFSTRLSVYILHDILRWNSSPTHIQFGTFYWSNVDVPLRNVSTYNRHQFYLMRNTWQFSQHNHLRRIYLQMKNIRASSTIDMKHSGMCRNFKINPMSNSQHELSTYQETGMPLKRVKKNPNQIQVAYQRTVA